MKFTGRPDDRSGNPPVTFKLPHRLSSFIASLISAVFV